MVIRTECINKKCKNKAEVTDGIQHFCKECLELDLDIRLIILTDYNKKRVTKK